MSLLPRWFKNFPSYKGKNLLRGTPFSGIFNELDESMNLLTSNPSGLSVYSDESNIYVEAAVPGLSEKDLDVSIDNEGVLWIKGEKQEEEQDKNKKYYRKALRSFSYCIPLWGEVDENSEPKATCKDGMMKITFKKNKQVDTQQKKIPIQWDK